MNPELKAELLNFLASKGIKQIDLFEDEICFCDSMEISATPVFTLDSNDSTESLIIN